MNITGELIIGLSSIFCTSIGVVLIMYLKSSVAKCQCVIVLVAKEMYMVRMNYQLEHEQQTHLAEDHIPSPTLSR
jgi:hypothetical protein